MKIKTNIKRNNMHTPIPTNYPRKRRVKNIEYDLVFRIPDKEILKFLPNGEVYVRGELVDSNREIYNAILQWAESNKKSDKKETELKCGCGADKLGLPKHSDWCPFVTGKP